MKDKVHASKGRKVTRPTDALLLKRLIELQKLREQVRLAEVSMKPGQDASHAGRP
jgi:hypothetical protein